MIKDVIFTITHPSYWSMNYPYNKTWDKRLNELADKYTFERKTDCYAKLGDTEVWIKNYPYACFEFMSCRPSRRTIHRLHNKLINDLMI